MTSRWFPVLVGALVGGHALVACTVTTSDDDDGSDSPGDGGSGDNGGSSGGGRGGNGGMTNGGQAGGGAGGDDGAAGDDGVAGEGGTAGAPTGGGGEGGGDSGTVELLDCGSRATTNATVVEDDIEEDTTWSGTVHLANSITITRGAALTIEPGTQIIAASGAHLEFGWNGNAATVIADGTERAPIRFCGERAEPGYWRGLTVRSNVTSSSVLRHVLVSDAGDSDQAVLLEADVRVDDLQVRNSASDGVWAADFDEGSQRLTVEGADGYPVVLLASGAAHNFPLGGTFEENGTNLAAVRFTDIEADTTFAAIGIPYLQESAMSVVDRAEVVFEAGVEYRFEADAYLEVGWNGTAPSVVTNGTEDDPVVFRGAREQPGFWEGILIRSNVASSSTLTHTVIRHAGGDDASALSIESPIKLQNVTLEDNEQGVWVSAKGLDDESENLTVTRTEGPPVTVQPNALVTLPQGGAFTGNSVDEIAIEGGDYTADGTVPNLGVPYRVLSDITARRSRMVLAPGTHFLMSSDSHIEFGWNGEEATIIAAGTEDEPIRFTGADETAGFWTGLIVRSNVLSASKFDYVEIAHAVNGIQLAKALPITNSSFADCSEYGISTVAADTTDYSESNTFTNMGEGDVGRP